MESKFEQKLSIIILGTDHTDPTIYPVLDNLIKKIHKDKIPCAFLEEAPAEQKLLHAISLFESGLEFTRQIKKIHPQLEQYFGTGSEMPSSDDPHLQELVQRIMPYLNPTEVKQKIMDFMCEKADTELVKFYKTLKELKIHYRGIDLPEEEYAMRINAMYEVQSPVCENEVIRNNEQFRIDAMVKNIIETTCKFSSGGILIVSVGALHAHRLGANLLLETGKKSQTNVSLQIQVLNCVEKSLVEGVMRQQDLSVVDSPQIKKTYQSLPFHQAKEAGKDPSFSFLVQYVNAFMQQFTARSALPKGCIRIFDIKRTPQQLFDAINESACNNSSPEI